MIQLRDASKTNLGLVRIWNGRPKIFALVSMASGIVSTYLMNRERGDTERASGIAHVAGWLWLGLASSMVVTVSALMYNLKRPKTS
jgi:hypothetical protein